MFSIIKPVRMEHGELIIYLKEDFNLVKELYDKCALNHGSYMKIKLSKPYRGRTTGEKSQNHAINGFIAQICQYTGDDFNYYKYQVKLRAIKRGYPYRTNFIGDPVPYSETEIDTVQAGYLIDQLHEDAAFLGIILEE